MPSTVRPSTRSTTGSWVGAAAAVARRPSLWPTAVSVVRRLARPGWWHRRPFLPLPDAHYWEFRSVTAFGPDAGPPQPDDVVAYLEWCRAWPQVAGRRRD